MHLWIVEMKTEYGHQLWMPTVGCGLNRKDGREQLKKWRSKNSGKFRLRKYTDVA